ncbi:hypothetical protein ACFWBI_24300 [Streptomyces sp. NPDC059982]|uniref:hypothetical protein n=2 Tax=unclassified Streptomyces TaxID=2593676 RepID=UPI0036807976
MRSRTKTTATALAAATLLGAGVSACVPGGGPGRAAQAGREARAQASPSPSGTAPAPAPARSGAGPLADRSGQEILTQAYAATRSAGSAHVTARVDYQGKPMRIDLSLDKKGNCNGAVRLDGMGKLDIIKSSELLHFRGDAAYWRGAAKQRNTPQKQTEQMVTALADRWVKIPVSDPRAASMTGSCDLDKLTGDFGKGSPLARKGESTTVDGKPALAVTSPARQGTQTDYVATEGKPYVLKSAVSGESAGEALFSDFDVPVDTASPQDSDVLDLSKIGGPAGEAI